MVAARDLKSKRKGSCHASVVFGIGKQKFRTSTVQSDSPVWNEESTFEIKGNDLLKFKVRDKDETIGKVVVPLSQIPGVENRHERWTQLSSQSSTVHGELCFEAWVSKGTSMRATQLSHSQIHNTASPSSPVVKHHNQSVLSDTSTLDSTFKKMSPPAQSISRRFSQGVSHSTGDLTAVGQTSHQQNTSSTSLSDIRDATSSQMQTTSSFHNKLRSPSPPAVQIKAPEVTGISPRSGPLSGGTRLTLRGSNLGQSADDVIGLTVCGIDCLSSLEYSSPAKLICTTFPSSKSVSGPVVVKTRNGGKGMSTVTFTYKQHDYDVDEVPLDSMIISHPRPPSPAKNGSKKRQSQNKREKVGTREAELEDKIVQLERHVKDLEEENAELKAYIDKMLKKVMEANPGLLMNN